MAHQLGQERIDGTIWKWPFRSCWVSLIWRPSNHRRWCICYSFKLNGIAMHVRFAKLRSSACFGRSLVDVSGKVVPSQFLVGQLLREVAALCFAFPCEGLTCWHWHWAWNIRFNVQYAPNILKLQFGRHMTNPAIVLRRIMSQIYCWVDWTFREGRLGRLDDFWWSYSWCYLLNGWKLRCYSKG